MPSEATTEGKARYPRLPPRWFIERCSRQRVVAAACGLLADGTREVVARAAAGPERARLWDRWRSVDKDLDSYARRRSTETVVVVLAPRPAPAER